jgi:hypothetical protein
VTTAGVGQGRPATATGRLYSVWQRVGDRKAGRRLYGASRTGLYGCGRMEARAVELGDFARRWRHVLRSARTRAQHWPRRRRESRPAGTDGLYRRGRAHQARRRSQPSPGARRRRCQPSPQTYPPRGRAPWSDEPRVNVQTPVSFPCSGTGLYRSVSIKLWRAASMCCE